METRNFVHTLNPLSPNPKAQGTSQPEPEEFWARPITSEGGGESSLGLSTKSAKRKRRWFYKLSINWIRKRAERDPQLRLVFD